MADRPFLEFFAGIGLVRLGLQRGGWAGVFANDIDPKKREMYVAAFPSDPPDHYVLDDVHRLRADSLPAATLATASFPCTDVSLAGYRKGLAGEQSGAFWGFARVLSGLDGQRPPIVMIENVPGLVTSHGGGDLKAIVHSLNRLGYSCDAFVLDALHFVPQSRARLFVVGIMDRSCIWDIECALAKRAVHLKTPQLTAFMLRTKAELRWSTLEIPSPPRHTRGLSQALEDLPDDSPRWWSKPRVDYLVGQMSSRHRQVVERLQSDDRLYCCTVYRRMRGGRSRAELRADDIAGCLRTPRGGSSRQVVVVVGQGSYRARFMTPREYARLQGVPDSFPITVPDNQALFGFGDAVCVPAIEWITLNVLNPLLRGTCSAEANTLART